MKDYNTQLKRIAEHADLFVRNVANQASERDVAYAFDHVCQNIWQRKISDIRGLTPTDEDWIDTCSVDELSEWAETRGYDISGTRDDFLVEGAEQFARMIMAEQKGLFPSDGEMALKAEAERHARRRHNSTQ